MEVIKVWNGIAKVLLAISGIGCFVIAGLSLYTTMTGNVIGNVASDRPVMYFLSALVLGILSSYMFLRVRKD